jgi:hypothetical protein
MQELASVCQQFVVECLSFLESSEPTATPQCEGVFLGPDLGFVNIMVYNDQDGTCEISMQELQAVCSGAMFATCVAFLESSEQEPECEGVFLGPDLGFVNIMQYNDADGSCQLSMSELQAVCSGEMFQTCMDFLASSEDEPQCEAVFLGPDLGFVNVMAYNDADGSCQLSIAELATVCASFLDECLAFLESSEPTAPQCEPVFLGPDLGFVNIMQYNDADGSCEISMQELAAVCSGAMFQTCLDFIQSSQQQPECEQVFLGPDLGFQSLMVYNDADGTCELSMQELQAVCSGAMFATCLAFLESSEQEPECESVFLGDAVGFVNIMAYNDADGSCQLSMSELQAVCSGAMFQTCLDFLESSEDDASPQCEAVFLGPDLGFVNVMAYNDADGSCQLSMQELASVCQQFVVECLSFLESSEESPTCEAVFLGPDLGYQNLMEYNDADGTCELSITELQAVCSGAMFQTCLDFLESSELEPECEGVFLGPDLGFVNIMQYNDQDGTCEISMQELSAVCSGAMFQTCLDFIDSSQEAPQCEGVFLGPDLGFVNIMQYNDADGTCEIDIMELQAVCSGAMFATCLAFLESSEPTAVPQCEQVYLGPDIGFASIMQYSDADGTCTISLAELSTVCESHYAECIGFLNSSEPPPGEEPQCEQVYLGPDIGFANVMAYNDADGSCSVSMAELADVCSAHFAECMAFLESSEPAAEPVCEQVYLGPDIGFADVMAYNDADGSCTVSMAELATVCSAHFAECMSFLDSSEPTPVPTCEQVYLGEDIGFASVMEYHDDDQSCRISMVELASVCQQFFNECLSFLESSEEPPAEPVCEPVYLGEDIGFANIMSYHDDDGSCTISMAELATVCEAHFAACLSFLQSGSNAPVCESIYLGPDVGWRDVSVWDDTTGDCQVDMPRVQAACEVFFEQCLVFLEAAGPSCEPVYLGPDIGMANIMSYNDADGTCTISMAELATVCNAHFAECLSFLESSEDQTTCDPVYLGPQVDYQVVLRVVPDCIVTDTNDCCEISAREVTRFCQPDTGPLSCAEAGDEACAATLSECIMYLEEYANGAPEPEPEDTGGGGGAECDPVFLGPDIGWANVMEFHDNDGSCTISMNELAAVCEIHFAACISFIQSADDVAIPTCEPVYLGPDIGMANIMEYHDEDGTCTISIQELAQVCEAHFAECLSFLDDAQNPGDGR